MGRLVYMGIGLSLTGAETFGIAGFLQIGLRLLSARQQEVRRGELNAGHLWNGSLAQSHAANGGHVRLRAKDVQRNSQSAAKVAHSSQTLLIVGPGTAHKDRYVVLDQLGLELSQGGDDAYNV